jgi:hypothetical protein
MNIIRNTILGVVGLAGFAMATPAQAHDHYRGHYYYRSGPRVHVTYGSPYYYSYRPYYYSYDDPYYRPYYGYSYGPGLSFAFGGHRGYYYHGSHGHHHHHH